MTSEELLALPRSRAEAKASGAPRYYTGEPCQNGHLDYRYTSVGMCNSCSREWNAQRRVRDGDAVRAANRNWKLNNPVDFLLKSAKQRAAERGLDFNIAADDIVIPTHCPVLGTSLQVGSGKATGNSPTIDRIDSRKGYVKGNVAVISRRANIIKNDGTAAELRLIADWMDRVAA